MRIALAVWITALALVPWPGRAQIASDGTLATVVTSAPGAPITVTGGTAIGANLFHSFHEFNGGARFEVDPAIRNVIVRVTGGSPYFLSGISAVVAGSSDRSSANILLVNPHGVGFGESVFELGIGLDGAFFALSASEVRFADGAAFSAATPAAALTAAEPERFGFSNGLSARIGADSLDFEGVAISLTDAGVVSNRWIHLDAEDAVALVRTDLFSDRGIGIGARELRVEGSRVWAVGRGSLDSGIAIGAEERARLTDSEILTFGRSQLIPIAVATDQLSLSRSRIHASGFSSAPGLADLVAIEARGVRLREASRISLGAGIPGSNIRFVVSDRLVLEGGSQIATGGDEAATGVVIVIEDPAGPRRALRVSLSGGSEIFCGGHFLSGEPQGIELQARTLEMVDSKLTTVGDRFNLLPIRIDVDHLLLSRSEISALGSSPVGEIVDIRARTLASLVESRIHAPSGEVSISGRARLVLDDSTIDVSGPEQGGDVALGTPDAPLRAVLLLGSSRIDVSSPSGADGTVSIDAKVVVPPQP